MIVTGAAGNLWRSISWQSNNDAAHSAPRHSIIVLRICFYFWNRIGISHEILSL
jgi:hypothetical protein